jgi:hypothetical protein
MKVLTLADTYFICHRQLLPISMKKYNLVISATDTMTSRDLEGIHIVKSIIDMFTNDNYSGYIRIYQKGGKEDFKNYKQLTKDVPQNQELYNIGFCFKPGRKSKFYNEIFIAKVDRNPSSLLNWLQRKYPTLKGAGIYSSFKI